MPKRRRNQQPQHAASGPGPRPRPRARAGVRVSGLPGCCLVEDVAAYFGRCGVVEEDPNTGAPAIDIERPPDSPTDAAPTTATTTEDVRSRHCQTASATVQYFRPESVALAIDMLDDTLYAPGYTIRVTKARFDELIEGEPVGARAAGARAGDGEAAEAAGDQPTRTQLQKRIKVDKKLSRKLADWSSDDDAASSGGPRGNDRMVILKGMFSLAELAEDASLLLDLRDDVREEAGRFGEVAKVLLFDKEPAGVMAVIYRAPEDARACVAKMDGRWFGGRQVVAHLDDGKHYRKTDRDDELEDEQRLEEFGRFIEGEGED